MAREGLASLFPIEELSIVGLAAIVRAAAEDPAADPADRRRGDCERRAGRSRDHRQPRFYPSRGAAGAGPRSLNSDRRLCFARRSGPGGRAARAPCARYVDHVLALLPFEPEAYRRLGGPPCSYVGHPLIEQIGTLRPDAGRADAPRRAAAGPAGAAGQPPQRDQSSHGRVRRNARPAARRGRRLRARCCRPCRICEQAVREGGEELAGQPRAS